MCHNEMLERKNRPGKSKYRVVQDSKAAWRPCLLLPLTIPDILDFRHSVASLFTCPSCLSGTKESLQGSSPALPSHIEALPAHLPSKPPLLTAATELCMHHWQQLCVPNLAIQDMIVFWSKKESTATFRQQNFVYVFPSFHFHSNITCKSEI